MAQPVVFNDYMPKIWNDLMAEFNNEYGVAGIMGNLYAESGCTPYACQPTRPYSVCQTYIDAVNNQTITEYDFVHYGCSSTGGVSSSQLGFGLAQWTETSRKQGFYTFMFQNGSDISDLENEIAYVIDEISNNTPMYNTVANATDIDTVADYILVNYENPKDKSEAVKRARRQWATEIYDQYTGTTPVEPSDPQPPSPDSPTPRTVSNSKLMYGKSKMPLWMMLRNKRKT